MFSTKAHRGRPDLFVSAKCAAPVPAADPAVREALVQASLDPLVRSISHVAQALVGTAQVDVDAVVLARDDGRYVLDVVAAPRVPDPNEERLVGIALSELGLARLVLTADDLNAEPRCSNSRLVWSHRGRSVPIDLRIRILQILIEDGPLELGDLLRAVRSDRDPSAAVMALACGDLLELDLMSRPLGPTTMARWRT